MRMPQLKCHDRWSTVAQRIKYVSKSTRSMQLSGCACAKCINMQWQKGNFVVNATQVWKFTFSMNFTLFNYRPLKKYRKDTVRHFVFVLFSLWIIGASYFRFNCEVNCLFECDDYRNSNGDCKYFDMQVLIIYIYLLFLPLRKGGGWSLGMPRGSDISISGL